MSVQKVLSENTILQGDSAQMLASLPDGSVHCIVTSPPYYQQRDYSTLYLWVRLGVAVKLPLDK